MLQTANQKDLVKKSVAKKEKNYKFKKQYTPIDNTATLFNFATKKYNDNRDDSDDNIVGFKKPMVLSLEEVIPNSIWIVMVWILLL